ncbi:hypothetical protein [uncultured Draconibacterium sp.]|uniref:hypothetical protein n=1 Tax=uncultured Draconibacterium sp. TaxID=1573823 RepID=UPI0029C8159E|nr:hypothetical protein [uncultured Draconibacterium sp.]
MEKLIINQLAKTLKRLRQIINEVENYQQYTADELWDILFAIHQFVTTKDSSLNVFISALDDFMKGDANNHFKLALISDMRKKLEKYEKKEVVKFPDSLDFKSLLKFKEDVKLNLISNWQLVNKKNEIAVIYEPLEHIRFIKDYPGNRAEIATNLTKYYTDFINAEIVIPFYQYDVKFTWDLKRKPEHRFKPAELNEYIESWINLETTVEHWLKFKNIDVFSHLSEFDLSEEQKAKIRQLQFQLFNEISNNIFQNRHKIPFEELNSKDALLVASRDMALIELLINGNINEANQKRVEKLFRIKDWKKAVVQFEDLLRNKYSTEDNFNIYHEDSYLYPSVVLRYKDYLEKYLKKQTSGQQVTPRKAQSSKNNKVLAFNYTGEFEKLGCMLSALHRLNAISTDIKLPQFKKLFNGEKVENPIPWHAGNGDLMVFIQTAIKAPEMKSVYNQHWNITVKCFTKADGSSFSAKEMKAKPTKNAHLFEKAANNLR